MKKLSSWTKKSAAPSGTRRHHRRALSVSSTYISHSSTVIHPMIREEVIGIAGDDAIATDSRSGGARGEANDVMVTQTQAIATTTRGSIKP